jgi:hypothetical protein
MPRAVRALTVLVLVLAARSAAAKPKISVLGLEVGGVIDTASTSVAHDVTEGLRAGAKQGGGPYVYAPNSDRELIDEKVLKNCDSEGPLCMSDIGKDMGTDLLIYGQIERRGRVYRVTLHVLDVRKKKRDNGLDFSIPGSATSDEARALAKRAYGKLVGDDEDTAPVPAPPATGTLQIRANAADGAVFVDDEETDSLSNGKATLELPEGRYRIAIEAPGYRRKERTLKITAGDSEAIRFELLEAASERKASTSNPWKPTFYVTASVAVALGGYATYEFIQARLEAGRIDSNARSDSGGRLTNTACKENHDDVEHFRSACGYYQRYLFSTVAASVIGAGALGFGYLAFIRHPKREANATASKKQRPARDLAILPSLSGSSGGAVVLGTW